MNNSDKPAIPCNITKSAELYQQDRVLDPENANTVNRMNEYVGLTKREHFAAMAMQGIISNSTCVSEGVDWRENIGTVAVELADALLKALEQS